MFPQLCLSENKAELLSVCVELHWTHKLNPFYQSEDRLLSAGWTHAERCISQSYQHWTLSTVFIYLLNNVCPLWLKIHYVMTKEYIVHAHNRQCITGLNLLNNLLFGVFSWQCDHRLAFSWSWWATAVLVSMNAGQVTSDPEESCWKH